MQKKTSKSRWRVVIEEGGNRRGERKERGNKKEVPSHCPELPISAATPSKKHSAQAIEDVVSN